VEKREEEREGKQAVSLQPAQAQEPINFVRETSGLYINGGELNHYSLHSLLIAIFQKLKCSKMIAIFAIGMGCGNK